MDFSGAILAKPASQAGSKFKQLNMEDAVKELNHANSASHNKFPLRRYRPVSMLRSARNKRGRRLLVHRNDNELYGDTHLRFGSLMAFDPEIDDTLPSPNEKLYCGKVQRRYTLNIIKAWYGNPKKIWSRKDGVDVTSILRKRVNKTTN